MTSRRNLAESLAIKHVDPELWRWLKARTALEGKRQGQLLGELIERLHLKDLQPHEYAGQ